MAGKRKVQRHVPLTRNQLEDILTDVVAGRGLKRFKSNGRTYWEATNRRLLKALGTKTLTII